MYAGGTRDDAASRRRHRTPTVVLVNHWGGIPGALAENLVLAQRATWAAHARADVLLGRLDPALALRALLAHEREPRLDGEAAATAPPPPDTLLAAARAAGYRTHLLGAHGLRPDAAAAPAARHADAALPDPRRALDAWGVDACSAHDGARFRGRAAAHDEEVLREARHLLAERGADDPPLLLWINLLACRDLQRVRFHGAAPGAPAVDVCTARPHVASDRRTIPPNVGAALPRLTARLARADARRHGDAAGGALGGGRRRDAEGEYARLLEMAWEAMEWLHRQVGAMLAGLAAEPEGSVAIAHFASHQLALGEHGVRGGDAPTAVCCRGVWASTLDAAPAAEGAASPPPSPPVLEHLVARFVARACGLAPPGRAPPAASLVALPPGDAAEAAPPAAAADAAAAAAARVLVTLHGRAYACVCLLPPSGARDDASLLCAYDLDADADEAVDVLPGLAHRHAELLEAARAALPERVRLGPPPGAAAEGAVVAPLAAPPPPPRRPPRRLPRRPWRGRPRRFPRRRRRRPSSRSPPSACRCPRRRRGAAARRRTTTPSRRRAASAPRPRRPPPPPRPRPRAAAARRARARLRRAAASARGAAAAAAPPAPRPSVRTAETRINTRHR